MSSCTNCPESCRACEILADAANSKLDVGDLIVLGHVMAIAASMRGMSPLGALHLCSSHQQFCDGALAKMRPLVAAPRPTTVVVVTPPSGPAKDMN